ncbi:rho family-interacting cell polarization regulator 1 isoform X2 [Hyperolius riggenbachi]|uniref:rho family-interacting cell polarization regulator 1 isoform X2 n=1 Tax=Hyperolius riggenbachi TaxID=752182 RepID=UPI0035A3B90B
MSDARLSMQSQVCGTSYKAHSTMSLSMRPPRVNSRSITRSQSFAGVNSSYEKTRPRLPFLTPTVSRKSGSRVRRMFSMTHKSPPPKVPQPDRLDEVYNALKRGLGAYLEVHQMELDKLTTQTKESKRNSRLGFLYDLDKQMKTIERFIRRLEFHSSKIDELYEAYCIQRRLRDGAHNMVKAYTASPSSKEARESMSEAGKGYKEYTENMCALENELESHLGEFHIKMKGLAGFARLCAGDQYEIFMKYGRQRWKLKGRIEVNGKQVWDSEDMVFLPLITEFLSIKVTELKSLANHVVVGSVSCETKDLFAALPQVVAVDINDLGTIKLSLEVNWNPFDKDDQPSAASTVTKATAVNKRFSTYNPSPPDTPSLREQAFYTSVFPDLGKHSWEMLQMIRETLSEKLSQSCSCSDVSFCQVNVYEQDYYNMLRRPDDAENGAAWSISSESSDDSSSPQLSSSARQAPKYIVQPEVQAFPPDIEIAFSKREETPDAKADAVSQQNTEETVKENVAVTVASVANGHVPYSRTLSHISEVSFDAGISDLQEQEVPQIVLTLDPDIPIESTAPSLTCEEPEKPTITQELNTAILDTIPEPDLEQDAVCVEKSSQMLSQETTSTIVDEPRNVLDESGALLNDNHQLVIQTSPICFHGLETVQEEQENPTVQVITSETIKQKPVDVGLEEAMSSLSSSLDDYRGQFPELQALEREIKHLEEILLRKGLFRSRASSISLTVENALESFDFLNSTSDIEDSECSEEGGQNDRNPSCEPPAILEQSEPAEDSVTTHCISEGVLDTLTSGNENLDRALVMHLNNCNRLLLCLGTFGPLRCRELYALDKLMRESQILEMICTLTEEKSGNVNTAEEAVQFSTPKESILSFWNECTEASNVYMCSVETFLESLKLHYAEKVNSQQEGLADVVFRRLIEDIIDRKFSRKSRTLYSEQITIFQYWSYFESLPVNTLDSLILDLAKEVMFVQNLNSDDQNVVLKALKRAPESYMQKEGFRVLSLLLINGNSRVVTAVASFLRTFCEQQHCRQRALVCLLEQLEDEDVPIRVAGCTALGCLKAKDSIDQLIYLCQTDKDDVKEAAKQSLMLFGEEGKIACRHLEETLGSLPRIFAPGSMASTAF